MSDQPKAPTKAQRALHERAKATVLEILLEEATKLSKGSARRQGNFQRLGLDVPSSVEVAQRAALILMHIASDVSGVDILDRFEAANKRDEGSLGLEEAHG